MTDTPFTPVVFVKEGCPFCLKVRIFLLEAGWLDKVQLRSFAPDTDEERAIRDELTPHFAKLTYPTVQFGPDAYVGESDDIIARFAGLASVDPDHLPTYRAYVDGPMQRMMTLYRENIALKQQLA